MDGLFVGYSRRRIYSKLGIVVIVVKEGIMVISMVD